MQNKYGKRPNWIAAVIWTALAAGWIYLLFYFSGQTGEASGELSGRLASWLYEKIHFLSLSREEFEFVLRKLAHFGIFAVEGFLMRTAMYNIRSRFLINGIIAAILCGVMAAANEIHEFYIPGRDCSFTDMVIDFSGALLGISVSSLLCWIDESIFVRRRYLALRARERTRNPLK